MALIKCPECGKEVSDKALTCIHCGFPFDNSFNTNNSLKNVIMISTHNNFLVAKRNISEEEALAFKKQQEPFCSEIIILDSSINLEEYQKQWKNTPRCPNCGSTAITTGARGVNWTLGLIGAGKTVNRCGKCGHTWQPK